MFGLFIIEAGKEPVQFTDYIAHKPVVFETGAEAAEACQFAAVGSLWQSGYNAIKLQPRRIVSKAWKDRELGRFADGTYRALPWANLPALTLTEDHFAHVSTIDGARIAYTQDAAKGAGDIQTRVKPGRYLTQFYGDVFDAPTIARMAAEFDNEFGEKLTLSFARTADDIERVYKDGPSSCMSRVACYYDSSAHPVRVYAAGDLQLAYLERDGAITARALVWPEKLVHSRIYGDTTRLADVLESAGYSKGSLEGAKLTRIEEDGGFVVPYIDDVNSCKDCGDYLVIDRVGDINCSIINGLSRASFTCSSCDENVDAADCQTNAEGMPYCDKCYSDRYGRCEHDDIECPAEELQEVICPNGRGYRTTQVWGARAVDSYAFECEATGDLYSNDLAVTLADGTVWSTACFEEHGVTIDGKNYDKEDAPAIVGTSNILEVS